MEYVYNLKGKIKKPIPFGVLDIETTKIDYDTNKLLFGYLYFDDNHIYYFESKEEYFECINKAKKDLRRKNLKIFIHNIIFDLCYLYDTLTLYKKMKFNKSRAIEFRDKKNDITYYDSMNILLKSLKDLQEYTPYEKYDDEVLITNQELELMKKATLLYFHKKTNRYLDRYEALKERCLNDCRIVKYLLDYMFNLYGFNKTIASISYNNVLNNIPYKVETSRLLNNYSRNNFYRGGRVDCFKFEYEDEFYVYDFNSLYPSVMILEKYPYKLPKFISFQNLSVNDLYKYVGFVCIKNVSTNNSLGMLDKKEDKLMHYDADNHKKIWLNLKYFLELKKRNYFKDFDIVGIYATHKDYCFSFDYIHNIYKERKKMKEQGNKLMEYVLKILMNSSYGKFAQQTEHYKILDLDEIKELNENELKDIRRISKALNLFKTKSINNLSKNSNQFIASLITSYARMYLNLNIYDISKKAEVLYCDTDSIFCNKKLSGSFVGKDIGQVKLEAVAKNFICFREKFYIYEYVDTAECQLKAKGLNKNVIKENPEIIQRIKQIRPNEYLFLKDKHIEFNINKIVKLKEAVKRSLTPNTIIEIKKKFNIFEYKRPIDFENIEERKTITPILF